MNYYSHHIGDYLSATAHLTLLEHGAYRRLIDVYYIHESALPAEKKQVYRLVGARAKEEKDAVDSVLGEFFVETPSGWIQTRCDREIAITNKNRKNGGKGGRPPKNTNPNETQTEPTLEPNGNPNETQAESPRHPSPNHPITGGSLSEKTTSTTTTDSATKAAENPSSLSLINSERCKVLADRLTKLEKGRGLDFKIRDSNPDLRAWVTAGITDPQLREAYDLALEQRMRGQDLGAINPKFLHIFVRKVMQDDGAAVVPIAVNEWHESASGIEAKASELGLTRRFDEPFPTFKARVFEAAGLEAEAA